MVYIIVFLTTFVICMFLGFKYKQSGIVSMGGGFLAGCVMICIVGSSFTLFTYFDIGVTKNPIKIEETHEAKIKKSFSAWDGSHLGLKEYIKRNMNDPNSYENVDTKYWDKNDYLLVETIFRGKNAFGGVITNSIVAKVDLNGNVIEILKSKP